MKDKKDICVPDEVERKHHREELPGIVADILQSCKETSGFLTHPDTTALPSKDETLNLVHLMLDLVFPGYFGQKGVDEAGLPYHIGSVASELLDRLSTQLERSIRHECRRVGAACSDCSVRGQDLALEFLRRMPKIRALSAGDVRAAYRGDPAAKSLEEVIFCYPGLYAVTIYRLAHELHLLGAPILPRMMTEHAHEKTGIDIHPGADVGEEFFVDHGTGVVIGETTVIGNRVTLYQGVTLGALSFMRDEEGGLVRGTKRHPTIEDDVVIYAGATVLGGNTIIGAGCVIGGNAWVMRSAPPGTKITIASPELVYRKKDTP